MRARSVSDTCHELGYGGGADPSASMRGCPLAEVYITTLPHNVSAAAVVGGTAAVSEEVYIAAGGDDATTSAAACRNSISSAAASFALLTKSSGARCEEMQAYTSPKHLSTRS